MNTESASPMRGDAQKPDGAAPDPEALRLLQRLRTKPKSAPKSPTFRTLVWDAALGVALGILLIVVFSLMFKPLQWGSASLTGH